MASSPKFLAWLLLILLALIWGSSFILMKLGLVAFSPVQMASIRLMIAGLVLSPFLVQNLKKIPRKKIPLLLISGLVGNAIPAFLFAIAETRIDSAVAGILNSMTPLFILVTGWVAFQTKFSWVQTLGVGLGLGGAVMMVFAAEGGVDFSKDAGYSLLVVLATICYAFNTNLLKYALGGIKPVAITAFSLGAMALPAAILLFAFTDFFQIMGGHPQGWASFGYIAILGAVGTGVAVALFVRLLQLTNPVFAGMVTYLIPIVAVIWGLIFGENLNWMHYTGLGVIVSAVYLVRKGK